MVNGDDDDFCDSDVVCISVDIVFYEMIFELLAVILYKAHYDNSGV